MANDVTLAIIQTVHSNVSHYLQLLIVGSWENKVNMHLSPSQIYLTFQDGEFRFLLSKEKVLEVVHKKPVDETAFTATLRSGAVYNILNLEEHKAVSTTGFCFYALYYAYIYINQLI